MDLFGWLSVSHCGGRLPLVGLKDQNLDLKRILESREGKNLGI